MIPDETVRLILDSARVEDVVGEFVTLKRRGADFVACCPFHNEKTPSFHVSPTRGIYKCFGCGKAGSSVGFLMDYEHMSYVEALKYLAAKYHIEVQEEEESAEDIVLRQKRESLFLVSEFARGFYRDCLLNTQEGRTLALGYCHKRGMEDSTVEQFGIGWAPSGRTALLDAAVAAGYKPEYLVDAGLCLQYDDGRIADRFHERVMFPIQSLSGRTIAFSGRTLRTDDTVAKYVNSPETDIYTKGHILFGIYLAKNEIARQGKCYLVEGNVDVVSLHQLGIRNVVAPCGTALTIEQVRLIKRFTSLVTVMFDGDKAGIKAAQKSINLILREDMDVKVVFIPDGDDPDSFARKHTLQEVEDFISESEQDFITFKTQQAIEESAGDPYKRSALINDLADTIACIPDAVKRTVFVQKVAEQFSVQQEILFQRVSQDREKEAEDAARERERSRRRQEAGLEAHPAWEQASPGREKSAEEITMESFVQNPIVFQAEREILHLLLVFGTEILDFQTDSEYYSGSEEDKPTVADFIIGTIEEDGGMLINPGLQSLYAAYVSAYDAGKGQDEILMDLFNSPDRSLSFLSAQLSTEKYELTVKSFAASMTAVSSALVRDVPKTLLYYAERKIENSIQDLLAALPQASDEEQNGILTEVVSLQKVQRSIKVKLGREKNK